MGRERESEINGFKAIDEKGIVVRGRDGGVGKTRIEAKTVFIGVSKRIQWI